jgi:DNA-binding MarR family transcriptional regulator
VKGVSVQTAMKYVNKAIADGYLEEIDNPTDKRSRLLRMSTLLRDQFAQVIDRANAAFLAILKEDGLES